MTNVSGRYLHSGSLRTMEQRRPLCSHPMEYLHHFWQPLEHTPTQTQAITQSTLPQNGQMVFILARALLTHIAMQTA